jgi:hypothetical protein
LRLLLGAPAATAVLWVVGPGGHVVRVVVQLLRCMARDKLQEECQTHASQTHALTAGATVLCPQAATRALPRTVRTDEVLPYVPGA